MNLMISFWLPRYSASARRFVLYGTLTFCLLTLAQSGFAKPEFPPVMKTMAVMKAGGAVEKANTSCKLCHEPSPPKMNPYATDLKTALQQANKKQLTPEVLQAVADKDSDGDGFSNAEELAADTMPGDPASKPAGAPSAAPVSGAASTGGAAGASESSGLFSPKTLLFPDHGQHPLFVHFPIALFMVSVVLDLLGIRKKQEGLQQAAHINLVAAAITSPFAVISGLIAWQFRFGAAPLEGLLLNHLLLGIATSALLFALWWVRIQKQKNPASVYARLYAPLSAALLIVISLTGHLGGAMVYGV